jgi:hypothetical protein
MILWEQSTGKTMLLCITIKIQLLRLLHWIWKGQQSIHPLTISSYNVGKTILDRSTYKRYNGQDVIISFSKNTGSNAAGSYYGGNLFKEQNANKVGYFYADMGLSANTPSQGWENTDRGWRYKEPNGSYVTNTWVK